VSLEPVIDNNVAFLICRYTTGDAAGQNMVTIATNALCEDIAARCPVPIRRPGISRAISRATRRPPPSAS
jgi:hydroxymethylglutaryl-CoA reductase (NADPH)